MPHNAPSDEAELALVEALRRCDERSFAALVSLHHAAMVRLARAYVRTDSVAEEVAQDAWLALFQGVDRFEGRSALRTWLGRVVANLARTRATREARCVPLSSFEGVDGPTVDPSAFHPPGTFLEGHWATPPARWDESPDGPLHAEQTLRVVRDAIAALPDQQAAVMTLRDIDGWTADEVCSALGLSEGNQRVLLHRARARVRAAIAASLGRRD